MINASWVGIVHGLRESTQVGRIIGALHGIDGILEQDFVDLKAQPAETLEACANSPASVLLSTRRKPDAEDNMRMLDVFRRHEIRFVFGIGGNDTSETLEIINKAAKDADYEIRVFHVPKTIDCDLVLNDHTPGYGSAARFVARAFMGVDLDNACFGGIYVGVCMGRHAGFLTAASAICRSKPSDGPHLVYVPERPIEINSFLEEVCSVYERYGRCVIAVSEGVETSEGMILLESLRGELERDTHGNVQLSGTGALADALIERIRERMAQTYPDESFRGRGDTLGYPQRSYPDQSEIDRSEAYGAGRFAAQMALAGNIDGSVTLKREDTADYRVRFELVELSLVAGKTRTLPDEFINSAGNNVTRAFIDWAMPLVGEMTPRPRIEMQKMAPK